MPVTVALSKDFSPQIPDTIISKLERPATALRNILPDLRDVVDENPEKTFSRYSKWPNPVLPPVIPVKHGIVQAIIFAHQYHCSLRISPFDIRTILNHLLMRSVSKDKQRESEAHQCQVKINVGPPAQEPSCGITEITLLGHRRHYWDIREYAKGTFDKEYRLMRTGRPHDIVEMDFLSRVIEMATLMFETFGNEKNPGIIAAWKQIIGGSGSEGLLGWFPIFCYFDDNGRHLQEGFEFPKDLGLETEDGNGNGAGADSHDVGQSDASSSSTRSIESKGGSGKSRKFETKALQRWYVKDTSDGDVLRNALPVGWAHYGNDDSAPAEESDDSGTAKPKTLSGAPAVAFLEQRSHEGVATGYNTLQAFTGDFELGKSRT